MMNNRLLFKTSRFVSVFILGLFLALPSAWSAKPKFKKKIVKLDLKSSVLKWDGKKVTGAHNGTIKLKSGQANLVNDELAGGEFVIDMSSIENEDIEKDAGKQKLVGHLKSGDFFDVAKFPTATFKIKTVKSLGAQQKEGATHEITGDMTIKGITHPVTFSADIKIKEGRAEAKGTITLDRTLWDIRYGSGKFFTDIGDKMIYDEFTIGLNLIGSY